MFCMNCGHEIDENATCCPRCGTPVNARSGNAMQDTRIKNYGNKKTTKLGKKFHVFIGIVAIFLGSFRIHKYLMGRRYLWILYFAFCWTFIPLLIGIVEGIIYLSCSEEKFEKKYLYREIDERKEN